MSSHGSTSGGWESEIVALRHEISELRAEQKEMASAINQMVATFRMIATHLGIAAEPYVRGGAPKGRDEPPGFA
jgi:hypothetical protein